MSIRPSHRKRSVVQVLADGMDAHPPTGRSCCEEAALTANELARRNEVLSEAEKAILATTNELVRAKKESQAEIEALTKRAEKAEAERDEWKVLNDIEVGRRRRAEDRRHELQAKLDAAENRPTLDRDKVFDIVFSGGLCAEESTDEIMALAPAAEGWPDWLGPRPVLRAPVRNADGNWTFHDGNVSIRGDVSEETCRDAIKNRVNEAVTWAGVLSAIKDEQAATSDEDQRVEEQAKALREALYPTLPWYNLSGLTQEVYRNAIRAGWTPPANKEDEQ